MTNNKPSYPLKFKYHVKYFNGERYTQNDEDKSTKHPGQSCYADIDQSQVAEFTLFGPGLEYVVNIPKGKIVLNKQLVFTAPPESKNHRIYYWRNVTHSMNNGAPPQVVYKCGMSYDLPTGLSEDKYYEFQ